MKSSLLSSVYSKFRYLLELWWSPQAKTEILYPHCVEDLLEILGQVRENQTQVKVIGGTFPLAPHSKEDIIVSLSCMDKLIGLDVHQQTVTAEPGVRLSNLVAILETVNMTLELAGPLPDLSLVDAIAIGLTGTSGSLSSSVLNVEVVLAGNGPSSHNSRLPPEFDLDGHNVSFQTGTGGPELAAWSWSTHPDKMATLFSGLGMVAAVTSVTLKCIPLYRVTEVSHLLYLTDVMDTWGVMMGSRGPSTHHLTWFPFSELVILKQARPVDRSACVVPSILNRKLTEFSQIIARLVRILNLVFFSSTYLGWTLARIQFISLWSAAKNRSDFSHPPVTFLSPDVVRGSTWLLPLASLPPLLSSIKQWANTHPSQVTSPLQVCTVHEERRSTISRSHSQPAAGAGQPYLYPRLEIQSLTSSCSSLDNFSPRSARASPRLPQAGSVSPLPPPPLMQRAHAATVWYDWFLPETGPDPREIAELEELFRTAGGIRCWSGDRIVSPLILSDTFPEYSAWCKVKHEVDPDNILTSGYVQGDIWSKPVTSKSKPKQSRSSPRKDQSFLNLDKSRSLDSL
eukprot:TRINITY_DN2539_c1_g1_i10.p1 TRINITY_DN2539_c1_g1~~TRINITY_DN2539_c1_g1_i10.p1  ORF type:complete len:569 (-),score=83.32 TRINITY_DN2539_c1_g1_i10:447-2153(-)